VDLLRTDVSEKRITYITRVTRIGEMEAIEIEFHPYNINRDGDFCLSKSWKPIIGSLTLSGYDQGPLNYAVPTLSIAFALTNVKYFSSEAASCNSPSSMVI
jgi:hypothetical protein